LSLLNKSQEDDHDDDEKDVITKFHSVRTLYLQGEEEVALQTNMMMRIIKYLLKSELKGYFTRESER